jgi:hypothetical protein
VRCRAADTEVAMTQPASAAPAALAEPSATAAQPHVVPATPPATPAANRAQAPATAAATDDKPLGEAGLKALAEERAARKALEQQVAALQPLTKLAEALGVQPGGKAGKTDIEALTERIAAQEKRATEAEMRAVRLEVAAAKGLTPAQAARLQGATREELDADADALKELFPTAPGAGNGTGTPAPDPSQGARGGANDLKAAIVAAQQKGDVKESIRLKQVLAAQQRK